MVKQKKIMKKKGQQEMVGFVLIVVLVVVAMMIFLIISIKKPTTKETESIEATHMLDALLEYTTDCAVVFVPQYDTVEELFKSAYEGNQCTNKGVRAKDYLEETVTNILNNITTTDSQTTGYHLVFLKRTGTTEDIINEFSGGDCSSATQLSAQRIILSGGDKLVVRLTICQTG